jgi:hypothetical protein
VVLFHAFPKAFSGGYVGVDVFSSFPASLSRTILFTEIAEHRFSFFSVLWSAHKTHFPALFVCLACRVDLSVFVCLTDAVRTGSNWRKHVISSAQAFLPT